MKLDMMTKRTWLAACVLAFVVSPAVSRAEDDPIASQEPAIEEQTKRAGYAEELKIRYSLTDEQLKALRDKGMNDTQITIVAQLAKSSEKPIDDIVKMRLDQKMGWGKIAKELGLEPGAIGQAVSSMHNGEKKADKMEMKKERAEARAEKRADKRAKMEAKREAKTERKKQ